MGWMQDLRFGGHVDVNRWNSSPTPPGSVYNQPHAEAPPTLILRTPGVSGKLVGKIVGSC